MKRRFWDDSDESYLEMLFGKIMTAADGNEKRFHAAFKWVCKRHTVLEMEDYLERLIEENECQHDDCDDHCCLDCGTDMTEGPWRVTIMNQNTHPRYLVRYAGSEPNADGEYPHTCHANARLIAAAPDLLEALKAAREYAKDSGLSYPSVVDLAIAKAEDR